MGGMIGNTSSESNIVHSGSEIEDQIATDFLEPPKTYYEGDLSMHSAMVKIADESDAEVDSYQGDLSMHPTTDSEGDESNVKVDGCLDPFNAGNFIPDWSAADINADATNEEADLGSLANPVIYSPPPSPEPNLDPDLPTGIDIEELCGLVDDEDMGLNLDFIKLLCAASLDDEGMHMDPEDLHCLWNPPTHELTLDNSPDIQFVIDLFLANYNNPINSFNFICKALLHCYPKNDVYTYDQTKQFVRHFTDIVPLSHDMCVNTCIVYTARSPATIRLY